MEIYKNMNKICTTIEQSKKLLELGIDVKTADMFWDTLFAKKPEAQVNNHYFIDEYDDEHRVPAWSLSALFKMLPYSARLERGSSTELYCLTLPDELKSSDWYVEPIDAVFEMVCWLKDNGKL